MCCFSVSDSACNHEMYFDMHTRLHPMHAAIEPKHYVDSRDVGFIRSSHMTTLICQQSLLISLLFRGDDDIVAELKHIFTHEQNAVDKQLFKSACEDDNIRRAYDGSAGDPRVTVGTSYCATLISASANDVAPLHSYLSRTCHSIANHITHVLNVSGGIYAIDISCGSIAGTSCLCLGGGPKGDSGVETLQVIRSRDTWKHSSSCRLVPGLFTIVPSEE